MYKPIKLRDYQKWIKQYDWSLHKAKIDWNLYDQKNKFVCYIKVRHPGPKEVVADSVKRTERALKSKGLL